MDTKNVLVFLAGAAVAYFVIREMDKQKALASVPPVPVPVPPVDTEAGVNMSTPLIAPCEEAMMASTSVMRFASAEAAKEYEDGFMSDCLANPEKYLIVDEKDKRNYV